MVRPSAPCLESIIKASKNVTISHAARSPRRTWVSMVMKAGQFLRTAGRPDFGAAGQPQDLFRVHITVVGDRPQVAPSGAPSTENPTNAIASPTRMIGCR